jgi:hypothetical protein
MSNEYLHVVNKKAMKEHLPMLEAINANDFKHINVRNRTIQRLIQEESIQLQQGVAQQFVDRHVEIHNYNNYVQQSIGDAKELKALMQQVVNNTKAIEQKTLGKVVQTNPDGSISVIEKGRTTRIKLKP